jgi:hypothetical protein
MHLAWQQEKRQSPICFKNIIPNEAEKIHPPPPDASYANKPATKTPPKTKKPIILEFFFTKITETNVTIFVIATKK